MTSGGLSSQFVQEYVCAFEGQGKEGGSDEISNPD